MEGHEPVEINEFNGLWQRGSAETTPLDHFSDAENLRFIGTTEFGTRFGIGPHQDVVSPLNKILRIYNFVTQNANTPLVLVQNGSNGEIYHVVDATTVHGPLLTITGMTDFAFAPYAGRAYISPFTTYSGIEKGMENEFLYVYLGDGTAARKAAGVAPTAGSLTIANGTGNTDAGFHLFGVLFETDTGFLSAPARFTGFTTGAANGVSISNIPVSASSAVIARRIVVTRVIVDYNGDTTGYTYYFLPDGRIADNVTTVLNNITFFDADLLEEASFLIDNYDEIPAGAALTIYHDRLCLATTFDDISIVLISKDGEPEAISQLNGLIIAPPDGNPITNVQEMRDILYVFKRNRTISFVDSGDVPTTWPMAVIDYGLGAPVHGVATVIDSGSVSADFLLVATFRGIMLFSGKYPEDELTWKIKDFWEAQDRDLWRRIHIINDTVGEHIYCALPDRRLLIGDYSNGMDPKRIRWIPIRYDVTVTTVALVNINKLIIGSEQLATV